VSLLDTIRQKSAKRYSASDGNIYLLQRVNNTMDFLSPGLVDLLFSDTGDLNLDALENMDEKEIFKRLRNNPESLESLKTMMAQKRKTLEAGLIGEVGENGKPLIYKWVEKNAFELEPGEMNFELIPEELVEELVKVIEDMSPKPSPQEGRDVKTFPEIQESVKARLSVQGDRDTPEHSDLGLRSLASEAVASSDV
jgi:hypothetical protein